MALIRMIFWFAIFLGATFVFTVIFEHGPLHFSENSKKEFATLQRMFMGDVKRRPDQSDQLLK
jgi:hypothetical protein